MITRNQVHDATRFASTLAGATLLAVLTTAVVLIPARAATANQAAPPEHEAATSAAVSDTTATPAVAVAGNFEGKTVANERFGTLVPSGDHEAGWGWSATDDQRVGGHSEAAIKLIHPGAHGSDGALHVSGELKRGFVAPWAGATWFPGAKPMQPADLSGRTTLEFWARAKPGSYSIMLMTAPRGSIPKYSSFQVTDEWQKYSIPLASSFPGANLKEVYFIAFSAASWGQFQFDLDRVQLK